MESNPLCIQMVLFALSEHFSYPNTLWSQRVLIALLYHLYILGSNARDPVTQW